MYDHQTDLRRLLFPSTLIHYDLQLLHKQHCSTIHSLLKNESILNQDLPMRLSCQLTATAGKMKEDAGLRNAFCFKLKKFQVYRTTKSRLKHFIIYQTLSG